QPAESLGYLGLGLMGAPMTRRLLKAGYEVRVWNRSTDKATALVEAGAKRAASPRDVAAGASVIFMCVTDTAAVGEEAFGPDGRTGRGTRRRQARRRLLVDPSGRRTRRCRAAEGGERHGVDRRAGLRRNQGRGGRHTCGYGGRGCR